jgi:polysaccharide deacetylase 2 family uncharacterized protein YibQ
MTGYTGVPRLFLTASVWLFAQSGWSAPVIVDQPKQAFSARPRIALIIDDLGNALQAGKRTAALDGPVACAILPHTPFGQAIAQRAFLVGKEVLLHLPLQPVEQLEPASSGTIIIDNTRTQLLRIFEADIVSIPHVVGVSNHMGSLLTRHPGHMEWLMDAVKAHGNLFFVDSYTTVSSVALQLARERGVPAIRRDVFLDNVPTEAAIDREFRRLKQRARKNGIAVGIGHPYPETLQYLEQVLPTLMDEGIELVSVGRLVDLTVDGQTVDGRTMGRQTDKQPSRWEGAFVQK